VPATIYATANGLRALADALDAELTYQPDRRVAVKGPDSALRGQPGNAADYLEVNLFDKVELRVRPDGGLPERRTLDWERRS
jgi:hypothetical protein